MLPRTSTLRSIRPLLADDSSFIGRAFDVLRRVERDHGGGSLLLRVGITGTGQYPNYRIDDLDGLAIAAIDGGSHQRWPGQDASDAATNWSDAAMTLTEVRVLLAEVRGISLPR